MKMMTLQQVLRIIKTEIWWTVTVLVMVTMVANVTSLSGPHVCMVKQKYNITKRVKYRAPMAIRTYEWCFAMPPRCSKWTTEIRDVTRLETEERTAEMAACCPGFKLRDVSCTPACPSGKTGQGCLEDCPPNKWGPSCVYDCKHCVHGSCDALRGECRCQDGWQGESCETSMTTTAAAAMMEQLLTTETLSTKTATQTTPIVITRSKPVSSTTSTGSSVSNLTTSLTKSITKSISTVKDSLSYEDATETTTATIPATIVALPETKNTKELSSTFTIPKSKISINESLSMVPMTNMSTYVIVKDAVINETIQSTINYSKYNRTEYPSETEKVNTLSNTEMASKPTSLKFDDLEITTLVTSNVLQTTVAPVYVQSFTALTTTTTKIETRKNPSTNKQTTTTKHKPKEIWIKPAQKGDSPMIEDQLKLNHELPQSKLKLKELVEITTPKTIIVSIIPTSVTYVTFKKIALTTATAMKHEHNISKGIKRTSDYEYTKPMIVSTTSTPFTVLRKPNISSNNSLLHLNVTKVNLHNVSTTGRTFRTTMPTTQTTNSMSSTLNVSYKRLNSPLLTTSSVLSTNGIKSGGKLHPLFELTTGKPFTNAPSTYKASAVTENVTTEQITVQAQNNTVGNTNFIKPDQSKVTKTFNQKQTETNTKRNLTISNVAPINVTEDPTQDEETFPILTEPEHITAVMGDKGNEKTTYNLISALSIAGGVMMAIITVAIVIVMLERCRRPRYEDGRKYNDIKMQVMIDNNDVPPPYVRSIFHTPLPDPPSSEKCHYQPISTLDRNLKQFMRPVVVQTISPLMLENFRGILECHYDHLPRRSQDMGTMQTQCSMAPSVDEREELLPPPRVHSLTDSDIEAMKCEAQLDVIDNTTSEPLYAEIPCWRPPSAHAIEVVNLNGEAVTEL